MSIYLFKTTNLTSSFPLYSLFKFPKKMKFILLCFLLMLALLLVSSSPCNFPAIFNLGDSNSDTGGLSAAFVPRPPPYGETFFGMPAGRYSDGRLMIDFIVQSLGLPFLSAYLDSIGTNFSHGANFATAGSTIIDSFTQGGYSPFSLGVQLSQFSQFKSRLQLAYQRGGVFKYSMPDKEYFSEALYTIDIGQNDLTAGYFLNKSADEFIPDAMRVLSAVIKSIYDEGGRYFWVHNTGPLGCLSYVLLRVKLTPAQIDHVGCGIPYNELAQRFNLMLNETVAKLRRDLPLAVFTYVDVYSAKYSLISQATKYGFEHPLTKCCGYGGGAYEFDSRVTCGDTGNVNGTEVLLGKSCADPAKRIIWDGAHYTEAANKWVFDRISTGAFSHPRNSLRMACHKKAVYKPISTC